MVRQSEEYFLGTTPNGWHCICDRGGEWKSPATRPNETDSFPDQCKILLKSRLGWWESSLSKIATLIGVDTGGKMFLASSRTLSFATVAGAETLMGP